MGYTIYGTSCQQIVNDLIKTCENEFMLTKTLKHTLRGNVLWSVKEVTIKKKLAHSDYAVGESFRYIGCDLIEKFGHQWGYKDMCEEMHPSYYSCPLSYFEMVPEACPEWRLRVYEHHQKYHEDIV